MTEGYFDLKALGEAEIKGVEEPLNVYEVLGAGPLRTRLQVSARRGLTRFVGRHGEMDQMQQAVEQAKAGHGQIVGVMGEPGLGKSRLFYEFKLISQSGCLVLEAFAVSHGKASPYLPLIELLKDYFQIEPSDDERIRKEKVTGRVLTLDRSLEDTLSYLFSLLGVEDPDSSLLQMDAQIRRQRTFEALKKLFLRESLNQPLILIFEDLHWIDTETQGFLDTLSESVASAQLLLLVNYRPEYRHNWGQKTYYTQLRLAPLGKGEAEELLTALLGDTVGATGRLPLHDLKQHASLRFLSGQDPGVASCGNMSYALWTLGYPEQARQAMQGTLTLAREVSDAFSVAHALALAAGCHLHYRDYALAQEHAEAAITFSTEHGIVWWHVLADIFCGGALAAQGQPTEGIAQIQQGLEVYQTIGAELWRPYYLAVLAEAYRKAAQPDKGLSAVADALARVNKTEERWYEAELYRLKGELTLQQSKVAEEAEACFHKAIAIAQHQQAKSWELRAATSLAQLWQKQGKTAEAHDLLAPVYKWFTEGFDTADLKDAKALLDELAA